MESSRRRFGVVVPVKPPAQAKSRLSGLGDAVRRELAAAFALDTVAATLAADGVALVLVVTDDHRLADALRGLGAVVIPDGVAGDLNASVAQGAAEVRRQLPSVPVAALCADLPALRSAHLDAALDAAPADRMGFVADADGVGTTLVTAPDLTSFRPRFGPGSRDLHLDDGAVEIEVPGAPSLRRDVDTPDDLAAALRLGIGARTARVAAGLF